MDDVRWVAMDPYPRTTAADTRIHEFWSAVADGRLLTSRCRDCGESSWPPRVVCPGCLSEDLEWADLPRQGVVAGFTVQEVGLPPGFAAPAVFALVDVGPVRVFTLLVDTDPAAVAVGGDVEFVPLRVPPAPAAEGQEARWLPAFRVPQGAG